MQVIKKNLSVLIPFLGLILVIALIGIASEGSLFRATNLNNILDQIYTIIILAVACSFIYAHGGFDLAVGAVFGLSMMLSGYIILNMGGSWIALPICLAVSLVCYLVTGLVTVKLQIPPFITTLCVQFLCRGAVTMISKGNITLPAEIGVANNWTLKIIVLLILLVASYILMHHTVFGRNNAAIGENPTAARQSGIHISRVQIMAYLFAALLIGIAAFFAMARTRTVATLAGAGYELDVIVAIVLGGMALGGGMKSSVKAPIIGALIVVILSNGLVLTGINYRLTDLVVGTIFILVVVITYKRDRNGLLPR
ncbi:MAG: ABC transporter permease [Saccharofermentanales bacterium]|mgnify:CR=1 FL=1|jgi:ribose transport system permease protein|nr:ABC transporter permease [Clostridiaceae bacterium]